MTVPGSQTSLSQLFLAFARLGLTAFGGPFMIAYIRRMAVEQKHWLDTETFNDSVALCQMVPGATAMQVTASVGLKTRGVLGAAVCFIGFGLNVSPVLVIFLAAIVGLILIRPKQLSQKMAASRSDYSIPRPFLAILSAALFGFLLLFIFDRELFHLAVLLSKIDLTAFGGGFASIPLMFHEIVDVNRWMDGPNFMNGIVLGQVTPGLIVITAAFIGYLLHGPLGGLIATISIFTPSFLMVVGISPFFDRLRASISFNKATGGSCVLSLDCSSRSSFAFQEMSNGICSHCCSQPARWRRCV